MCMIRAVALDLEGTVVDLEWAHWRGHLAAAKEIGLELTLEDAVKKIHHFIGGPDEKIAEEIAMIAGNKEKASQILARDKQFFWEAMDSVKTIETRPGFLSALQEFRDAGLIITIGSLTESQLAHIILAKSGLTALVPQEHIVLREGVVKLKPAPDVYCLTAVIAGVTPKEQLVFEDSVNGIIAAKSAGSNVIAIPTHRSPEFLNRLIKAGASRIFFEWNDIRPMSIINDLEKEEE